MDLHGYTRGAEVIKVAGDSPKIEMTSGIHYAQIKHARGFRQLRMSVIREAEARNRPAILYFPGGGFTSADHDKYLQMRMALAQAGFVVAAAEYRTVPDVFPAQAEDAKAAIRFLRAHAETFGIDPSRIGVMGDSAGGYMAQLAATVTGAEYERGDYLDQPSDVQAAVTLYGISDLSDIGAGLPREAAASHASPAVTEALIVNGPAFGPSLGATVQDTPEKTRAASPIGHVGPHSPPFLILHGSADRLVSPEQSAKLYRALGSHGIAARYFLVEGAGHGDSPWYQPDIIARVTRFFCETLRRGD
ncbi:alpha/beta hydrolase [Thioclava kandeliae]|uniref:Alpha/beta hydrolase n=1 Tax=Thioclava kandeliae TaxID=3070818 RepID=A0ABV1SEL3_9RHOB